MGRDQSSRMRPSLPPRLARKQLGMVVDGVIEDAGMTVKQENVLRMRHGLSAADDHSLEFRGQNNPETRQKLAQMEKDAITGMQGKKGEGGRR